MNPVHQSHLIRRVAVAPTSLAALIASVTAGPAAFASQLRPPPAEWFKQWQVPVQLPALPPGWNKHPPLPTPAHVQAALAGGVPGWQIALIASGAAVLVAVLTVLARQMRAARRRLAARTT